MQMRLMIRYMNYQKINSEPWMSFLNRSTTGNTGLWNYQNEKAERTIYEFMQLELKPFAM